MFLKQIFAREASLLGQIFVLRTSNFAGQLSADSSSTETLYCLNSACPRKMPGWMVPVRENFSVNKRVCRKQTIEIVLRGFLSVFFSNFTFGFHGFCLKILKIIQLKSK